MAFRSSVVILCHFRLTVTSLFILRTLDILTTPTRDINLYKIYSYMFTHFFTRFMCHLLSFVFVIFCYNISFPLKIRIFKFKSNTGCMGFAVYVTCNRFRCKTFSLRKCWNNWGTMEFRYKCIWKKEKPIFPKHYKWKIFIPGFWFHYGIWEWSWMFHIKEQWSTKG